MDTKYKLFTKTYPKNVITLNNNTINNNTNNHSQYIVLITPNPLTTPQQPTTIDNILTHLPITNPQRNTRLFFHQLTYNNYHHIKNYNNTFTPNLTNLNTRTTPQIITKSIINPNNIITKNFQTLIIKTKTNLIHHNFLHQKNKLNLKLINKKKHIIQIPKTKITHHQQQPISIIPNGFTKQYNTNIITNLITFITNKTLKSTKYHEPKIE